MDSLPPDYVEPGTVTIVTTNDTTSDDDNDEYDTSGVQVQVFLSLHDIERLASFARNTCAGVAITVMMTSLLTTWLL